MRPHLGFITLAGGAWRTPAGGAARVRVSRSKAREHLRAARRQDPRGGYETARRSPNGGLAALLTALALALPAGCEREARRYQELPAAANRETGVRVGQLEPGMSQQQAPVKSPYQDNAWGMAEGKRLYSAYNCAPCHGLNGGGAIGPPLMDDKWIYGSHAEQVFNSIVAGRPNGMPAFGSKIPAYEVWQLAAYVRSMSGLTSKDAAPGRDDDMKSSPPENSAPTPGLNLRPYPLIRPPHVA